MKEFAQRLSSGIPPIKRSGEKFPLQFMAEHQRERSRQLRQAIKKTGKTLMQLSVEELIAINHAVDSHENDN